MGFRLQQLLHLQAEGVSSRHERIAPRYSWTLTVTATGVDGPELMAFDNAGNLWVASLNNNQVVALTAADLATSGVKTPLTTLNTADWCDQRAPIPHSFPTSAQPNRESCLLWTEHDEWQHSSCCVYLCPPVWQGSLSTHYSTD